MVVELWTDNSLPSATVRSNLHQVCVLIVQYRKLYVTIQIVERQVLSGVYNTCLDDSSKEDSNCESLTINITARTEGPA